jgi:hypothetical protein
VADIVGLKGGMNVKTILIVAVILLALVGVLSIVLYLRKHKAGVHKGLMNAKTILIMLVILLAMVGVVSIALYVLKHRASVQIKETSFLPRESIKPEGVAKFTLLTRGESDSLAMIEDQSLLGMSAGAFNPQFDPLSSSEQKTLKTSEEQKPELQNMTAGDSSDNRKRGWGAALFILLFYFLVIPF